MAVVNNMPSFGKKIKIKILITYGESIKILLVMAYWKAFQILYPSKQFVILNSIPSFVLKIPKFNIWNLQSFTGYNKHHI
jgi:hypothetical protein